jgi:hypothetical protein
MDINNRKDIVSISRIDPHKNRDWILKANKVLENSIKIYALTNPQYIFSGLINLEFDKY